MQREVGVGRECREGWVRMVEGGIAIEGGRGCAGSIEGVMEGRGSAEWGEITVGVPSGGRSLGECREVY